MGGVVGFGGVLVKGNRSEGYGNRVWYRVGKGG